jgi:hypothetical protein
MRKGQTHTPESRAKLSAAHKGRRRGPPSPETCANISAALKGRPHSREHTAKLAAALRGRPRSREICAKISAGLKGREVSEETRAKISKAKKGQTHSEETRRKMSEAKKGRPGHPHTQESRAKIAAAHTGLTASEETRRKMSEARKGGRYVPRALVDQVKPILDQHQAEGSTRSGVMQREPPGRPEARGRRRPVSIGGRKTFVASDEQVRVIELLDRERPRRFSLEEIGSLTGIKSPRQVLSKLLKHPVCKKAISIKTDAYRCKRYGIVNKRR